jgi:transcription termination factor Rho
MIRGVLELSDRGGGSLRRREGNYLASGGDPQVPEAVIKRFGLRPGDEVEGEMGSRGKGRGQALDRVTAVNGRAPEDLGSRPVFDRLTAIHPREQLRLERVTAPGSQDDSIGRVIDLVCPFGKGQRALIVAPAKAGKTTVLQSVAGSVAANYPDATLFILLVDERPEEVFEMEMAGAGEVVASTFDHPPAQHVTLAELTLERARRRVELGEDVVLIVDSLTRLARAYNSVIKGTGRTLTGGLDAQSLERPKRFLGSARAIDPGQGGGSLTIIATVLVDTGSKMDQLIFEEFKGTGNSELVLSRDLAERRVFPAIDLVASGTRKEELLYSPEALAASRVLRQRIARMAPLAAMKDLTDDFRRHRTNADLIRALAAP